jgi:two-component system phosphate regulon sensor histidine kinase PhoR
MESFVNRHRLVAALMISSQLLLTAFVIYWLVGQYRDEQSQLGDLLSNEYSRVHDQLVDSMLMKNLVLPSMDMVEVQEGILDSSNHARSINVSSMISDEERMVRSVKLFINANQETFGNDTGLHIFSMKLDSSLLVQNLETALEEKDWAFALKWPGEYPDNTDRTEIHGILLDGGSNRHLPALEVQQYGAYLIRSILPQILFALILLLLSASALLFAYRSLLRQLSLNRLREDFIANVSHELKTPVSTIKVALEALRSFDLQKESEKSDEYLKMASSELGRLEGLVGKVLHHEMLNNPSLVLDEEDCDLGELSRSVVRTMDLSIRQAGATVTVLEDGPAYKVAVDRVYVEGVIMNLMDNGLKYTGEHPRIQIMIHYKVSGTYLSVSDNGPGIPDEYKDQVFEKFFRIPSGNKHNVKGYGLGLNFARQVMVQHGGSISFKNRPEGGCSFTLYFPPTKK